MIGKYLGGLSTKEEDRVLTLSFRPICGPGALTRTDRHCCLVMTAAGTKHWNPGDRWPRAAKRAGWKYEELCERFGTRRINAAVRNRILANRARRTLTAVPEYVL